MSTKDLTVSNSQGLKLQVCIYYTQFLLRGIKKSNLGPHPVRQRLYWLSYHPRPLFCTFWNKIKAHSMHTFVSDVCVCDVFVCVFVTLHWWKSFIFTIQVILAVQFDCIICGHPVACFLWLKLLSLFYLGALSLCTIFFCIYTNKWNCIILWSAYAQ